MFFFSFFSYSTNNYLQVDYALGTATKPGTTNGYHQSATTTTSIPGRWTAMTTTTSTTARRSRRRRETMATEARDAYTSRASGTTVCSFFLLFFLNILLIFLQIDYERRQWPHKWRRRRRWQGLETLLRLKPLVSFFFFSISLTNTYIFTVPSKMPPSPLLSPPLPLSQSSSQPRNDNERGPSNSFFFHFFY